MKTFRYGSLRGELFVSYSHRYIKQQTQQLTLVANVVLMVPIVCSSSPACDCSSEYARMRHPSRAELRYADSRENKIPKITKMKNYMIIFLCRH